jgi:hypothetical protein
LGGRGRWISEFEDSLVYTEYRTARATQRNPVWKEKQKQKNKKPPKPKPKFRDIKPCKYCPEYSVLRNP